MRVVNDLPKVMREARTDLAGNISGQFSPEDWQTILSEAERRWSMHQSVLGEQEAWHEVVREFHREKQWGFQSNYQPPPKLKERSLGLSSIWMVFSALTITKIAVVWLGQIYTRSDDPVDKWLFFAAIFLVVMNFGYFLWRHRHHQD